MSVTTAAPTLRSRRFWTRARGIGVFLLLVASIILFGALTRTQPDTVSRLGLGIIGKPPPVRVSVPTQPGLIFIGLVTLGAGLYLMIASPDDRRLNTVLASSFALIVLAALIGAAANKSIDLVGMIKDSVRLATAVR